MHDTPLLACVHAHSHVQAFCARGEESVVSRGRCHKPQDVERHLSPDPPTHACTHARHLHVEAGTDINHWVGGAPGSGLQPAYSTPDKRACTRTHRALDRAQKKKGKNRLSCSVMTMYAWRFFSGPVNCPVGYLSKTMSVQRFFWILRLKNVPVQR